MTFALLSSSLQSERIWLERLASSCTLVFMAPPSDIIVHLKVHIDSMRCLGALGKRRAESRYFRLHVSSRSTLQTLFHCEWKSFDRSISRITPSLVRLEVCSI